MRDSIIDFVGIAGLVMLAVGLYLVSLIWMLIIMGSLFVGFALSAAAGTISVRLRKKEGP